MAIVRLILAVLVAALVSLPASAATTADRSPFFQGHWWAPEKAGSGFDIFDAAGQTMVVWFTYETNGRPVWYTAQGATASAGEPWTLLRHRWAAGRKVAGQAVGTLRFTPRTSETAEIAWDLNGTRGLLNIQPFVASTARNEVDHTGHWFAPAHDGWGFSLTHQGDVIGGVLFTYDVAGEPTWFAGFGRERNSALLYSYTGACPACTYAASGATLAGQLHFDFQAEDRMRLRNSLAVPLAAGTQTDGASLVQLGRSASTRTADFQLARFHSRDALKAFFEVGLQNIIPTPGAGSDFSASPPPPAPPQHSSTNLQELGVDEADTVKSDGRFIYTFAYNGAGVRSGDIKVAEVGAAGESLALRNVFTLSSATTFGAVSFAGLYLDGGRLAAVTGTQPATNGNPAWLPTTAWTNGVTRVELFDVSNRVSPVSQYRLEISGHPVATRRIGERLYVVSRYVPSVPGYLHGAISESSRAYNRQLLASIPVENLLPQMRVNGGTPSPAVEIGSVLSPPPGSSSPFADLIVVTAIDLASRRVVATLALAGSVETLYASTGSLYLATSRVSLRDSTGRLAVPRTTNQFTDIHQLRLGTGAMEYVGSATIEGFLGSQLDKTSFRLSEHQGRLRVVTSRSVAMDWGIASNVNRLTILEPSPLASGLLRTVSVLPNAARPELLGLPFEELYATRFMGDKLYAVTFTSAGLGRPTVDPLYVVDLAIPSDPRIRGELIIPGFSDYLHPLGNGLLLGVGRQVTLQGVVQGVQLSLFDVSDDTKPRAIQQITLGKRGTESAILQHHHAISFLRDADGTVSFAFPARIHDGAILSGSGDAANYVWQESGLVRYRVSGTGPATARLVAEPKLITHRPGTGDPGAQRDAAANGGRSIMFTNGVVYVANGGLWRQDRAGVDFGPF